MCGVNDSSAGFCDAVHLMHRLNRQRVRLAGGNIAVTPGSGDGRRKAGLHASFLIHRDRSRVQFDTGYKCSLRPRWRTTKAAHATLPGDSGSPLHFRGQRASARRRSPVGPARFVMETMLKNRRNYYRILHVQPDAPTEVIRASYRTMMQRLRMHPDLGGDHRDAALVNEAYAVLTNPDSRAAYDATRVNERDAGRGAPDATETTPAGEAECPFCRRHHRLGATIEPDSLCGNCWSPLYPAQKHALDKSGQRIIQRFGVRGTVEVYVTWPQTSPQVGETQDVSLNGMQLLTPALIPTGQIVKVTGEALDCIARVVNHNESRGPGLARWRLGLEFITVCFSKTHGTFVSVEA